MFCVLPPNALAGTTAKSFKQVKGFKTGDMVKAIVVQGEKIRTYLGQVVIRTSGSFNIFTKNGTTQEISWKYYQLIQGVDGYRYSATGGAVISLLG